MSAPTEKDRFDLAVLADSCHGPDAAVAISRLRASLDSWARIVIDLTHEKYEAEAEVDRLRAELVKLRGEVPQ